MAGRFPLYTDADIDGRIVHTLIRAGWDVLRAIDAYPEGTDDNVHFQRATREGRLLVSNDVDQLLMAQEWARAGRPFPGLVTWKKEHERQMSVGDIVRAFEELAAQDHPFPAGYPIVHLKPKPE